jgi:hypothetical protein
MEPTMTAASVHVPTLFRRETEPDWLGPAVLAVCRAVPVPYPGLARGCLLPAHAGAAATARGFTTSTLDAWGRIRLAEDLALAVAELFSNALRHGRGAWSDTECCRSIRLGLACLPTTVMCLVADPGSGVPVLGEPDSCDEGGRGLQVVDALATRWGCVRTGADGPGKTVWALFAAGESGAR